MKTIRWGILGAGDVAEVKSGPAFREAPGSELVAVMRRDGEKAADFARRHQADRWYDDAEKLIADPGVDAVYVATPPSSHVEYVVRALDAGKFVYVEKPMATDSAGCAAMISANDAAGGDRLVVAHYRRALPLFEAVGALLREGAIGAVRSVDVHLAQRPTNGAGPTGGGTPPCPAGVVSRSGSAPARSVAGLFRSIRACDGSFRRAGTQRADQWRISHGGRGAGPGPLGFRGPGAPGRMSNRGRDRHDGFSVFCPPNAHDPSW